VGLPRRFGGVLATLHGGRILQPDVLHGIPAPGEWSSKWINCMPCCLTQWFIILLVFGVHCEALCLNIEVVVFEGECADGECGSNGEVHGMAARREGGGPAESDDPELEWGAGEGEEVVGKGGP